MKHHATQRQYWKSLEHLANTPEIQESAAKEFASYDPDGMLTMSSVTRRRFMKLMGASMALAGLSLNGCRRWPEEKLAPYASRPPGTEPGVPQQYATAMELAGVASPLLVTSYDGRPIKVDGNPTHPFSETIRGRAGSADALAQASILEMYDPDRSGTVVDRTGSAAIAADWDRFTSAMSSTIDALTSSSGGALAVLCEATSSLTTSRLKAALAKRFPTTFYEYEPLSADNETAGIKQAMGKPARQRLHLDKAKVVVLLDADPLGTHPAHVRYAGDWVKQRPNKQKETSRVYCIESAMTISGSVSDCRMGVRPSRIGPILSAIAAQLGVGSAAGKLSDDESKFVSALVADVSAAGSECVFAVGPQHPPEFHALALAINDKIGAIGSTLTLYETPDGDRPHHFDSLADLTQKLKAKQIGALIILGGNPVYDAPTDLDFAGALKNATMSIHLSGYDNETSHASMWHVPRAHYLEAWGDARAWDGTVTICQPLIEPLYDGKTCDQLLAFFAGEPETTTDALVRKTFADIDELNWRRDLNDGLIPHTELKKISGTITAPAALPAMTVQSNAYEVRFQQDLSVYDGRFATSGWLQELPDPLSKIVWDNAALISPKDAAGMNLGIGDIVKITVGRASLELPTFILPGQPIGVIGLALGYGRTLAEHIGSDVGINTYALRTTGGMYFASAQVSPTGGYYDLATTQDHHLTDQLGIDRRQAQVGPKYKSADIIKEGTAEEYRHDPHMFQRSEDGARELALQLYVPPQEFRDPYAWGMAIDMSRCIGCHACVIACQAENNVPIVGRDNVLKSREMHWIRIDRYFKGAADDPNPEVVYQPLTCQQCENAPCEEVCPVGATTHDTEGINVMVYNRCVGTRYCSNNCPYKVRRFNYLDWHSQDPRHDKYPKPWLGLPDTQQMETVPLVERMMYNPEVTVRMRGVMEKCNFCLQRIHTTTISKRASGEKLKDGDILVACQQACPTQAIVFGDLNDNDSKVSKWQRDRRAYALLDEDLDTKPRNRFLAKISNPNPEAQA